jgi:hypothetical protein
MTYASCPTTIVNAPVELVWTLLTRPAGWGDFFDVRITAVEPAGPAVLGQKVWGESGPRFLHLKLDFRYVEIDEFHYKLGLHVRLPFAIAVREDLNCVSLERNQCRVNYHCDFGFPTGWRGAVARVLMRRELHSGPVDSLSRLKRAAEQLHALDASRRPEMPRGTPNRPR